MIVDQVVTEILIKCVLLIVISQEIISHGMIEVNLVLY